MDSLVKLEMNHNLKPIMKMEKRMVLPDGIYSESTKTRLLLCDGVVVTQELSVEEFDTVDQVATLTSWQRLVFSDVSHDRTAVELAEAMRKDGWTVELVEQAASLVETPPNTPEQRYRIQLLGYLLIGAVVVWLAKVLVYGLKSDWEIPAAFTLVGFSVSMVCGRKRLKKMDNVSDSQREFPIG